MSLRRMLPFIFINIVVSAVVVLAILYFWENRSQTDSTVADLPQTVAAPELAVTTAVAQPEAQSTETPEPADEPTVHVVKAGDTLATISSIYDVSMEDIMAVNNITNPNILSVGQQLVIPIGGLPTPTVPPTAEATAVVLPSPIPTEAVAQGSDVQIEITAVIGVGQLEQEAVQIRNTGSDPIALLDWKLADQDGKVYEFGQATLFGGSVDMLIHTAAGPNGPNTLYWGLNEPVWSQGELVTLLDPQDNIVATYTIP